MKALAVLEAADFYEEPICSTTNLQGLFAPSSNCKAIIKLASNSTTEESIEEEIAEMLNYLREMINGSSHY